MTVSAQTTVNSSTANGVTTVFPYAFKILAAADLEVLVDGVVKTLTTHYTVSGAGNNSGGDVTFLSAPAADAIVVRRRNMQFLRATDYQYQGDLPATVLNPDLDAPILMAQQLQEQVGRAARGPAGETWAELPAAADRLDKFIAFDATTGAPELSSITLTQLASAVAAAYAAGSLADAVTYTPEGAGAVSRSVQAKIRADSFVSPEDFDAIGDGTADDTAELQAAIDSGKAVRLTAGKTYKFTSDLTISTNFQYVGGPGFLRPDGNCGVLVNGGAVGVEVDVVVSSSTHTGVAVKVDTAHRTSIRLYAVDCYDAIYVTGANVCTIEWAWGACRNKGLTWYGTTATRSDVLHIKFALFSVGAGQYGLDWDGNCHSLEIDYMGIVCGSSVSAGNGYGAVIRNTSGGTLPAVGKFNHLEVDYSGTHGLDIQAGSDYDIGMPYILGATGAGVRVGAAINDYEVRIFGGKLRGNTTYGVEALGGVVLFGGATDLSSNTTSETTGSVWTRSPKMVIDTTHHISNISSNPVHTYDTNDYTSYDRTNNVLADFIAGVSVFAIDATRATFGARPRLPTAAVASLPAVHLAGDLYFATNGRKNGEGGGLGTGVLVFSDGTAWRACDTGATVAA